MRLYQDSIYTWFQPFFGECRSESRKKETNFFPQRQLKCYFLIQINSHLDIFQQISLLRWFLMPCHLSYYFALFFCHFRYFTTIGCGTGSWWSTGGNQMRIWIRNAGANQMWIWIMIHRCQSNVDLDHDDPGANQMRIWIRTDGAFKMCQFSLYMISLNFAQF
jgi:hypothetical protein